MDLFSIPMTDRTMTTKSARAAEWAPIRRFTEKSGWARWLEKNHATSTGIWVRLAKKASGLKSMTQGEGVEVALCYGWIDGQGKSDGDQYWLQRFTPRG